MMLSLLLAGLLLLVAVVDARPVISASWIKGLTSAATTSVSGSSTPHQNNHNQLRRYLQRDDDDWTDDNEDEEDDRNDNKNNNDKNNERTVIPDDVYHCLDPERVWDEFDRDKTVECDWDTHEWMIDELHEDKIPKHCAERNWEFDPAVPLQELEEWEEPCFLWTITYGDYVPSVMPSAARELL